MWEVWIEGKMWECKKPKHVKLVIDMIAENKLDFKILEVVNN